MFFVSLRVYILLFLGVMLSCFFVGMNMLPVTPSLLWIILFYFSIYVPERPFIFSALIAGLLQDALLSAPMGFYTFPHVGLYILSCFFQYQFGHFWTSPPLAVVYFLGMTAFESMLRLVIFFTIESVFSSELLMKSIILTPTMSLLFLFIFMPLLDRIFGTRYELRIGL